MSAPIDAGRAPVGGPSSLLDLLQGQAGEGPDRLAIMAGDRRAVSYAELLELVLATRNRLRAVGVADGECVAIALPNGADLAVAFLGAASIGACAPIAPDRPRMQHEQDLNALGASALIVATGHDTPARDAAAALGIPVIELDGDERAGSFTLEPAPFDAGGRARRASIPDTALLLFTSGTTSTPKLVPIAPSSLLQSARTVAATLDLTADDRCLNVMPLFHVHGLVAALVASITAGASVVCTPGFGARDVPGWIDELRPTWYTAVPTVHHAMLDVFGDQRGRRGSAPGAAFRFVRSSSAALPLRVMEGLERTFGAPVVEAYGMTEAAHQIASNPLPPDVRKPGTVGRPNGCEVALLDESGRVHSAGAGEIVLRGPTVTAGYLNDPEANATAFVDGWFRTGDEGSLDDDGYLTLTGRLKEIINRGGEKVAPREVDDALLEHGDVAHAVAFAVPHARLGEDVAAAVVLRDGAEVTGPGLRLFVSERLASYKVPRRVVVVDEIPRGMSGKFERTHMAARLGLAGRPADDAGAPCVEPADDVERSLADIWQRVLDEDIRPSVDADFFELGGDSLHAVELLDEIEATMGCRLPATAFFDRNTVRGMAELVRTTAPGASDPVLVPVQPRGTQPPLFCLMRAGSVVTLRHLAHGLGPDQPVFGLWLPSMHGPHDSAGSVEDLARICTQVVRDAQPEGPYFLFGHSFGGVVMYETARQLAALGGSVGMLALADSLHPAILRADWRRRHSARYRVRKLLSRRGPAVVAWRIRHLVGRDAPRPRVTLPGTDQPLDWTAVGARERGYVPGPAPGPVVVLATRSYLNLSIVDGPDLGWAPVLDAGWASCEVPGNHNSMIGEPHVHVLAERLGDYLRCAREGVELTSV
ncbi:MAG: AMP-binding protein [Acidimicrobiia bacterium]